MAKKIRTNFIKEFVDSKNQLNERFEASTREALDGLLEDKVNRNLRQILAESSDDFEEEDVDPEDSKFDMSKNNNDEFDSEDNDFDSEDGDFDSDEQNESEDDDTNVDLESGDEEDSEGNEVWDDVSDTQDEDGEYDLRGKDMDTVLKVIQQMDQDDAIRIVKDDDDTATVIPDDGEEFTIDINGGDADEFEDELDDDSDAMDANDGFDFDDGEDSDEDFDDDESMDDIDIDDIDFEDEDSDDDFGNSSDTDDDDDDYQGGEEDNDYNNNEEMNEGKVNLGYTDNYQKKTAMTMPHDKGDGEGDSRFDQGAPKGDGKRWVGTKGANGGNPYTKKTKQPMSEDFDECGDECIFEVELDSDSMQDVEPTDDFMGDAPSMNEAGGRFGGVQKRLSAKKHIGTNDGENEHPQLGRHNSYGGEYHNFNESRKYQNIQRKAAAIMEENKELRKIAKDIKKNLNEAAVINDSLAKMIRLFTENSTTRDEKMNILERFDKVTNLNESRKLYAVISKELQNAHSVNESKLINNQLNEVKGNDKNMVVETNLLNQSEDLRETIDLMKRLDRI